MSLLRWGFLGLMHICLEILAQITLTSPHSEHLPIPYFVMTKTCHVKTHFHPSSKLPILFRVMGGWSLSLISFWIKHWGPIAHCGFWKCFYPSLPWLPWCGAIFSQYKKLTTQNIMQLFLISLCHCAHSNSSAQHHYHRISRRHLGSFAF